MAKTQRPGTIYWIDHYTVGTNDLDRWIAFHERVFGAVTEAASPERRRSGIFQNVARSRHGGFVQRHAMPPPVPPGEGLPRYAHFIRPEDLDEHVRRLDAERIPYVGPIRTLSEGDEGSAIFFVDPDGNQFEFWAPVAMPEGAMVDCGPLKVGRVSHVVYESRDLDRTASFFERYCALEPQKSANVSADTLVFPLAAGGRIIFKHVTTLQGRTSGFGTYRDLHTALVVREPDFWPNYERMWSELPEWDFDQFDGSLELAAADAENLPARTTLHGSPVGRAWKAAFGRGDDWYDWDTNLFHFYVGVPERRASMATYEPRPIEAYMESYLAAREGHQV